LRVQTRVLVEEQPGRAILDAIAPSEIDLIALATHGQRGLSRLVLGSVADKVIRGASVPVLVQHPAQE
jgi:nucleotide-binding universal stress UspA family protein